MEKKAHLTISVCLLGLALYLLTLPWISPHMSRLAPTMWGHCSYYEMSGKPCPFCGFTRFTRSTLTGSAPDPAAPRQTYFPLLLGVVGFSVLWRVMITLHLLRQQAGPSRLFKLDAMVMIALGILMTVAIAIGYSATA